MRLFCALFVVFTSLISTINVSNAQTNPLVQHARQIASSDNSVLAIGPMSLYANPAGSLKQSSKWSFLLGVDRRYTSDVGSISAAGSRTFGENSVGILFGRYGINGFNQHLVGLSYSRRIGSDAFIGIQGNMHQLRIEHLGQRTTFDLKLGYWQQVGERIILSAYLNNPAQLTKVRPSIYGKAELSGAYILSEKLTFFGSFSIPWEYNISFSPGFRYEPISQFLLIVSFSTSPMNSSYGIGFEITPTVQLDLAWNKHPLIGNIFGLNLGYAID